MAIYCRLFIHKIVYELNTKLSISIIHYHSETSLLGFHHMQHFVLRIKCFGTFFHVCLVSHFVANCKWDLLWLSFNNGFLFATFCSWSRVTMSCLVSYLIDALLARPVSLSGRPCFGRFWCAILFPFLVDGFTSPLWDVRSLGYFFHNLTLLYTRYTILLM